MSHNMNIEPVVLGQLPEDLSGLRVLDCGVGHGQWAFILRTQKMGCPYIVGVEPHQLYVQWAIRGGLYDEIHLGTGEKYVESHPNEKFDVILLCEVIEHEPSKEEAFCLFNSLSRMLKPGGVIFVSTPDGFSHGAEGFDGNPLNAHNFGYSKAELEKWGLHVEGVVQEGYIRIGRVLGFVARLNYLVARQKRIVTHTLVGWRRI